MKPLILISAIDDGKYIINWTETFESWKYWCKKHDINLHIQRKPYSENRIPMWTDKWDAIKIVEERYPDTTHIGLIDVDILVRWDCPNFFEYITDDSKMYACLDSGPYQGLQWMLEVWKPLFPNSTKTASTYFNAGMLLMSIDFLRNVTKEIWSCYSRRESVNYHYNVLDEQTPLNHIVGDNLELLPRQFNDMVLFNYNDLSFMNESFMWHFTGPNMGGTPNKHNIMRMCWDYIKQEYID